MDFVICSRLESGAELARLSLEGVRPVRTEMSDMVPWCFKLGSSAMIGGKDNGIFPENCLTGVSSRIPAGVVRCGEGDSPRFVLPEEIDSTWMAVGAEKEDTFPRSRDEIGW